MHVWLWPAVHDRGWLEATWFEYFTEGTRLSAKQPRDEIGGSEFLGRFGCMCTIKYSIRPHKYVEILFCLISNFSFGGGLGVGDRSLFVINWLLVLLMCLQTKRHFWIWISPHIKFTINFDNACIACWLVYGRL